MSKTRGGKTKKANHTGATRKELLLRVQESAKAFLNASVAFVSSTQVDWMSAAYYDEDGAAYLVVAVACFSIENKKNGEGVSVPTPIFEIRWVNTALQSKDHVHEISESVARRGVGRFVAMQKNSVEFGES
ncbi:hypothetical protein GN958_ATG00716 [Phytophthora infestans]|uniref:Uncharacterized protein n=1 Tax=Phytophthora infestans TaxID=4787 RepID=A0A8S9VAT3_PHYIN|nr:hypothetical protein GN958_ATG00716 [Phytophthora infestans]